MQSLWLARKLCKHQGRSRNGRICGLKEGQKKGFQIEDALSEESCSASEEQEESASSDEANPALQFLRGLKEGQSRGTQAKNAREEKEHPKNKKEQKVLQEKQK